MKTFILALIFSSLSAQAALNDFECEFRSFDNNKVEVDVERSFNTGFKRISVTETQSEDQTQAQFTYFANARIDYSRTRIDFFGGGITLQIDLWPDTRPQFGRRYQADFSSFDIDNGQRFFNIPCIYTGF